MRQIVIGYDHCELVRAEGVQPWFVVPLSPKGTWCDAVQKAFSEAPLNEYHKTVAAKCEQLGGPMCLCTGPGEPALCLRCCFALLLRIFCLPVFRQLQRLPCHDVDRVCVPCVVWCTLWGRTVRDLVCVCVCACVCLHAHRRSHAGMTGGRVELRSCGMHALAVIPSFLKGFTTKQQLEGIPDEAKSKTTSKNVLDFAFRNTRFGDSDRQAEIVPPDPQAKQKFEAAFVASAASFAATFPETTNRGEIESIFFGATLRVEDRGASQNESQPLPNWLGLRARSLLQPVSVAIGYAASTPEERRRNDLFENLPSGWTAQLQEMHGDAADAGLGGFDPNQSSADVYELMGTDHLKERQTRAKAKLQGRSEAHATVSLVGALLIGAALAVMLECRGQREEAEFEAAVVAAEISSALVVAGNL